MELAHEFTFNARLADAVPIGEGPYGRRHIREVLGGEVTGERINGTVGTGGSDWILVGPDGWGRLDVRLTILTDEGAAIYVQYFGTIEYNDAAHAANAGDGAAIYVQYFGTSSTTTPPTRPTPASARASTATTTSASPRGWRPATSASPGSTRRCSSAKAGCTPARWSNTASAGSSERPRKPLQSRSLSGFWRFSNARDDSHYRPLAPLVRLPQVRLATEEESR